jgi:hypothetical protein
MHDTNRRESDKQIMLLQQKLDNHIDVYEKHCDDEEKRWELLIVSQERNTQSIRDLTTSTKELTESTRGIVETWQTANGVGKFFKWLSGFAILGALVKWFTDL